MNILSTFFRNPCLFTCFLVLIGFAAFGQTAMPPKMPAPLTYEQANALFGQQKIIKFQSFSLEPTDESKVELQKLVAMINATPGIVMQNILIIQIFSCQKELVVKPYLGVCRGQWIVDYLEKEMQMPRNKCLIQDSGASQFDTQCIGGSGANIYLKPGFYQK